jgi:hypothetical protein
MDRPTHEYKPLQVLKFEKAPGFYIGDGIFGAVKDKLFRKDYIFLKFLINSRNLFRNIFLQDKYISKTYLSTIKRFQKPAYKSGQFLYNFLSAFLNCFITAAAFGYI